MNQFKEKYSLISALTTYDNNYKFDDALIDNLSKKHFEYIESHQNSSLLLKYFGSVLHDSPTIKITSSDDALTITLNDYHCYDFACETCHAYGIEKRKKELVFPITFNFHRARIQLSRINKNGKLIYVNKAKHIPRLAYWLHDEILSISRERIKLGVLLEARPCKGNKGELLLEIDARCLSVSEKQKEQYINLFGKKYLPYWERFEKQWQSNGYVSQENMALLLENK